MMSYVGAVLALAFVGACGGHYHGYYDAPRPRRVEYRHYHRLDCDHLVECRYRDGRHRYRAHRDHRRYWHVHRTRGGYYKRCYVTQRRHGY